MKKPIVWAIDIDGVITANPSAMAWLTYHLCKNENNNRVIILSWRNGSDAERLKETKEELARFGIVYDELILAPAKYVDAKAAAFWKIATISEKEVDFWIDDEIKNYIRDYSIDLDRLLPKVNRIWI